MANGCGCHRVPPERDRMSPRKSRFGMANRLVTAAIGLDGCAKPMGGRVRASTKRKICRHIRGAGSERSTRWRSRLSP